MKRIKKIAGILAVLSFAFVLFYKRLIGRLFSTQEAGAIGIIGGADGPTAIYYVSDAAPDFEAVVFAALFFSALWLILHLYMKFKDK